MPPKAVTDEILKALSEIKEDISTIKSDITDIKTRLSSIETSVNENSSKIQANSDKIKQLQQLEQHHRNWSIRIFNLELPSDVVKDPIRTSTYIHEHLISPILQSAVTNGSLQSIPPALDTVDFAHTLRSTRVDAPPPIILRFRSRLIRLLVMKNKKTALANHPELSKILIVEDLTKENYNKLQELRKKEVKCWSLSGKLYFLDEDGTRKRL